MATLKLEIVTPEAKIYSEDVDMVTLPGIEGKQVPVAETVRGFKEILDGKHDDVNEMNFYMKGGIDEIKEK